MIRLMVRSLAVTTVLTMGLVAHAGDGGCQPDSGTYTFYRLDPLPAGNVGTGKFESDGGCTVNPGPGEQDWELDTDGQYKPVPPDGRSFCVHDTSPLTYEYKYKGDVISSGRLNP
jgi:hypothetical protein